MVTIPSFYPFATGSEYTASFAVTSSHAISASLLSYVNTASYAPQGTSGSVGLRGTPDICLITDNQYFYLIANPSYKEVCNFPPR